MTNVEENKPTDSDGKQHRIRPISQPMDVPVFNVVIYISRDVASEKQTSASNVLARVANLPELSFSASSEPLALKLAITEVKKRLQAWHSAGDVIPWLDPIPKPNHDEQTRLVPVHL